MPTRLPACDPCRSSKLSCDHTRPACSRCRETNQPDLCQYRDRPFKRKRASPSQSAEPRLLNAPLVDLGSSTAQSTPRKYPNPGYLGSSSHAAIYDLLPNSDGDVAASAAQPEPDAHVQSSRLEDANVSYGAKFIEELRRSSLVPHCRRLVEEWIGRGVNLALAGMFTKQCAETTELILTSRRQDNAGDNFDISRSLLAHSRLPLPENVVTVSEFDDHFRQRNARWETLGLFFTAVSRATVDLPHLDQLYGNREERRAVQKFAVRSSERCLDIALALDCLNDLQLLLLYENFIMHSFVDGDQSFFSWRRLGDVISALFALGYHERTENRPSTPAFLRDLRRTAFARAYSADKNVSIFLGRPPRMHQSYCRFHLPGLSNDEGEDTWKKQLKWEDNAPFDYTTDTRWSAVCAVLKEQILDLNRIINTDQRTQMSIPIQADAEAQWRALPPHFRLEGPLSRCEKKPAERDLLVSMRLNHLHVLLLLRLALVRNMPEPDKELITVAATMLSLVVEAIVLKSQLANSGTSLVWKVAYYGLPAAGIISLSLLNQSLPRSSSQTSTSRAFQDLSVLVANVETGALVHFEEPNYELLAGATHTIKSILDRSLLPYTERTLPTRKEYDAINNETLVAGNDDGWMPLTGQESWDFDIDFWLNLAEHPALVTMDNEAAEL